MSLKHLKEELALLDEINEELALQLHSMATINEMAKINKQIELRNEDDGDVVKFAHFHFKGVHFKFLSYCPQNKEDIMKMVAFKKETQKLSSKDIKDLIKLLNSKWDKNSSMNVYEASIAVWGTLHDREIDYVE